jgi:putative MATE family efflux protein
MEVLLFSSTVRDDVLNHRDLMVSGSIDRAIFHLGVPAALSALLQAGFLIVDAFWLGRVGPVALAAASTAGFVMWLAQTIGEGMASGSGSVLAAAVGSGERPAVRQAAAAGLSLAVWAGLIVMVLGLGLNRTSFRFMGTDPAVTEAGVSYMVVILIGMPAYFVFAWLTAAFRGAGDAATALRLLAVAAVVNVVVDPVLIFGIGPVPALGVTGAALATVLSWAVASLRGWWLVGRLGIRPQIVGVLRPPAVTGRAIRIGLPLGLQGAFFSLIYILLTRVTTGFGTPAVAALGVGHKLEIFNYFVCAGMGAAATTLVGQNLGASAPVRARRAAWRTLFLTIVPVGFVTSVLVAFPKTAVSVFSSDRGVLEAGVTYVLLVGMTQVFMAVEVVMIGAFAGAQWTVVPAALEASLTAARVPLAFWLVSQGWGVEGVWVAIASTTVVKATMLALLFASKSRRFETGSQQVAVQ